ncbi:MAG: adenosine kinase [Deltaproteobacteria bacterium]|nr:MAG: adenosine kinase [Deltaproteobacteria bacterium]TNF25438.1 MAG: adenosine kinase [Deltaproteobacteria bacterium]
MKKYHVYGIGNALVDMEIEVTPEFLLKANVEKGVMTLVDQNRQDELLAQVDGNQHKRSCGGSAANTIIAVSQFGGRSFYSCKVANDEPGDFYFEDLISNGVATNLHGSRQHGVTGKCMVFITPDADRTMNSFLGITETFSESELQVEDLKDSEWLYIEGYLVTSTTGRAAALKAKTLAEENGVKTAITLSDPAMAKFFKDGLVEMVGNGVDLLFCNEEEALAFTGKEELKEAFEELKKSAKSFAITQGPQGALLFDGEKEIDIVTNKVDAVDTNGAGDLFAGSFLYAITHGHDFAQAGRLACAASGELVQRFGARLPSEMPKKIYSETLA